MKVESSTDKIIFSKTIIRNHTSVQTVMRRKQNREEDKEQSGGKHKDDVIFFLFDSWMLQLYKTPCMCKVKPNLCICDILINCKCAGQARTSTELQWGNSRSKVLLQEVASTYFSKSQENQRGTKRQMRLQKWREYTLYNIMSMQESHRSSVLYPAEKW